jgi:hypothetical protein
LHALSEVGHVLKYLLSPNAECAHPKLQAALLQLETGAGFARLLAATASPEAMHHPAYDDTEAAAVATMVRCCFPNGFEA